MDALTLSGTQLRPSCQVLRTLRLRGAYLSVKRSGKQAYAFQKQISYDLEEVCFSNGRFRFGLVLRLGWVS